jgi:hypothetical protein
MKYLILILSLFASPVVADEVDDLCTNLSVAATNIADMRDEGVSLTSVITAIRENTYGAIQELMIGVAVTTYSSKATAAQTYQAMNEACYNTMRELL